MSGFSSKISKFGELLLKGRFFLLFQKVVAKTIPARWLLLKKSVYFDLAPPSDTHVASDSDDSLSINEGDETVVARIVRDLYHDDSSTLAFYEKFYRNGIRPWIAEIQGKVVGVVWLYQGYYISAWQGYDAYVIRLETEPAALFVCNVFVNPNLRGQGIFPKIGAHIVSCRPNVKLYTCIDEGNFSSIRAHEKLGFKRCGATYYFQIFSFVWVVSLTQSAWPKLLRLQRGKMVTIAISHREEKK